MESGAGVECREQMTRQPPRSDQHRVKTQLEIRLFGMGDQPSLRGFDDACLLARRHRIGGIIKRRTGLHLNERQQITSPRHDIDLAIAGAKAFCQDKAAARASAESPVRNAAMRSGDATFATFSGGAISSALAMLAFRSYFLGEVERSCVNFPARPPG